MAMCSFQSHPTLAFLSFQQKIVINLASIHAQAANQKKPSIIAPLAFVFNHKTNLSTLR